MKMKAVEITDIKIEDNLRLINNAPMPEPKEGQALIKVHYASVNRPDLLQRKGLHPIPKGASLLPGLDISGEIVAFGPEYEGGKFKIGDHICALLPGGGYAEYAVADLATCLPVPKNLSLMEASSLPECLFTVWNNLMMRGALQNGELCLIHGGTSGIGSFAIQVAKAQGATVITTAGTTEKCNMCDKLGADLSINYNTNDFEEVIEQKYGLTSVNVVLDMVGGPYIPKHINLMAEDARHVSIAFLKGMNAQIDLSLIMKKRLTFTGSTLRTRPLEEKKILASELHKNIWPWIEKGQIKPLIHSTFKLENVAQAHDLMKKSEHMGKIILEI